MVADENQGFTAYREFLIDELSIRARRVSKKLTWSGKGLLCRIERIQKDSTRILRRSTLDVFHVKSK